MSKKSTSIFIERGLLESKAYASLRSPSSYRVLALFWIKRKMAKTGRKGKEQWRVTNNGEITFSYREAKNKLGVSDATFRNAIDDLRAVGFIDIEKSGAGLYKSQNLYSMSERWRHYGTPEYQPPKERHKGPPMGRGFKKGNQLGRNCKKKTTVHHNIGTNVSE